MAIVRVGSVTARLFQAVTITPGQVPAGGFLREQYVLNGLTLDMILYAADPVTEANLAVIGARVVDASHFELTWFNPSAGALTPAAAQTIYLIAF